MHMTVTTHRRWIRFAMSMAIALSLLTPSIAQTRSGPEALSSTALVPPANLYGISETGLYIVRFTEPSLASYTGGIGSLEATSPQATGERRLDAQAPESRAYVQYLEGRQRDFGGTMRQALGRPVEVAFAYVGVLNAVAVRVSHDEAARLATLPGVAGVHADTLRELTTDVGPIHIGAPSIWNGTNGPQIASRGEGTIIGVIDSGINAQHPAFDQSDGDGYSHTNPYGAGVYKGWCATNPGFCNAKLIGAYTFHPNGGSPEDTNGHGSHTAGTAAGNAHVATFEEGLDTYNLAIQGVAPRANLVAYKVCDPSCPATSSIAAVNSAILHDQVDVLNYSISGSDDPWNDSVDLAFLDAYNAGIFVSASAGNGGPGAGTIAKTGPWNAAVAASTINRTIAHTLDVTGPTTPTQLQGLAAVPGVGTSIATDLSALIRYDATNPLGCDPFGAGSMDGALALMQRGDCDFATKVGNAAVAGAMGAVIFNSVGGPPVSMGGLTGSPPAVMLSLADGSLLRDYVLNRQPATVRINAGTTYTVNTDWEDIVAGFSSRGPSQFELLKPDFTAPGVNILAPVASSSGDPVQYGFLQGTSMASPHAAGAAALMMALHPTWSPAEIKSALASAAAGGLLKEDGSTPAGPFDVGSGLLDLSPASRTGLVFSETGAAYLAANPDAGGDPKTLNQPSVVNAGCVDACSWTRTVKSVLPIPATYTPTVTAPAGMTITVAPTVFTITPGSTQVLVITADVTGLPVGDFAFGSVRLSTADTWPTPIAFIPEGMLSVSEVADTHIPVVVRPASAQLPAAVSIETMFRSGSEEVHGLLVGNPITELTVEVGGLVAAQMTTEALAQDPTRADPWNNDGGTFFTTIDVPAGALRLIAEITTSEAPDVDLYVGTGTTPSAATEVCTSANPSWLESCAIDNPAEGTWWVLVQNWEGSTNQPDTVTLAVAFIPEGDAGNMIVDGPTAVAEDTEFDVTINWDEPALVAGEKWYGFFTLGTDAANPGNIGRIWVDLRYLGAPSAVVAPTVTSYQPSGTVVTATLSITNVGDLPLTWTIVEETAPDTTPTAATPAGTAPTAASPIAGLTAESAAPAPALSPQVTQSEVLWEQLPNGTSGIVSDYFIGSAAGAYSASDFVLTDFAAIETILAYGFDNSNELINQPTINWAIYADAGGKPDGHPEDGTNMAGAVWSYSAPVNGAGIDITGNDIALDLVAAGEDLYLTPGTYWLTVYPSYNVTGAGGARWNRYQAAQVGAQTQLVSPVVFGVADWTPLSSLGVSFSDTAFRIEGTSGRICVPGDTPWISLPMSSGTTDSGETSRVDVVLDAAGLSDGVYTAQLCVTTDDPVEPIRLVDVELTVGGLAYLQVAHLAPFAIDPGTAVTITLNSSVALSDFAYGDSTGYVSLPVGTYDLEIFPGSSPTPAITTAVALAADTYYSAIATGDGANQPLSVTLLVDDNAAPAPGKAHLRLGHLAPFASDGATADIRLQDGTLILGNIDFGTVGGYLPLDAGTYDLKITTPGGATTLIDPLPVTLAEGDIISAFATGEGDNQELGVFAWPPNTAGFFLPLSTGFHIFLPTVLR